MATEEKRRGLKVDWKAPDAKKVLQSTPTKQERVSEGASTTVLSVRRDYVCRPDRVGQKNAGPNKDYQCSTGDALLHALNAHSPESVEVPAQKVIEYLSERFSAEATKLQKSVLSHGVYLVKMDCGGEVGNAPNEPTSLGSANLEAASPRDGEPEPKDPEEFFDLQALELTPEEQKLCLQRYDEAANESDRKSGRFWIPWRAFVQLGGDRVPTRLEVRDYKLPDFNLVTTERALEPIPIGPDFQEYRKAD
ncbi:unnamed protein product, partial [Amoebophrya sp. A25]|eukprot:GSA25T00010684001.1